MCCYYCVEEPRLIECDLGGFDDDLDLEFEQGKIWWGILFRRLERETQELMGMILWFEVKLS